MIQLHGVVKNTMTYFALMCRRMDSIDVKMNKQFYHMQLDVKILQKYMNTDFSYKNGYKYSMNYPYLSKLKLLRFYPIKTEKHGYTKSSDEYLTEQREKVRREREKLSQGRVYCLGRPIQGLPSQAQLMNPEFKRCDYKSFSKYHLENQYRIIFI